MQVIEAQCASILVPHDHLHISHERTFAVGVIRGGTAALPHIANSEGS